MSELCKMSEHEINCAVALKLGHELTKTMSKIQRCLHYGHSAIEIVNKEGSAVVKDYCNIMSDWQSSESKDNINGFYCTEKKSITWVSAKNKSDKNEKYYLHPDRYYICRDLPDNTPPGSQRGACEVFLMRRGYV